MKNIAFFFLLFATLLLFFFSVPTRENYGPFGERDKLTQDLIVSRDPTRLDMYNLSQAYLSDCQFRIKLPITQQQQRDICSDTTTTGLLNDVCR